MKIEKSTALYEQSLNFFPGGVNSPVRAFRSVGGTPVFIKSGKGAFIRDVDDNEYIDFCASWGPLIHGHSDDRVVSAIQQTVMDGSSFGAPTQLENELASLILSFNSFIEKIRFVSSGTEAVMSAIRLARGYTGKNKIIKFEGCYHGHVDSMLVKAGSGLVTFGNSSSAGVPESFVKETIVVELNNEQAVEQAFAEFGDDIAAIIIEPIPANNGLLLQRKEFLQFLRDICTRNNALLIFDEVISGFRTCFCGAAGHYMIRPDICTYGKIIGGGLPVGAYGASKEIMKKISPDGDVYQAGTLSGNPVAMAAGIATLTQCLAPGFYQSLEQKTARFIQEIYNRSEHRQQFKIHQMGSIFWLAFSTQEHVRSAAEISAESMKQFKKFYHELLSKGVYFGPSGYEVGFVSSSHSEATLNEAAGRIAEAIDFSFAG
jgi:glutamate-1-semialdehyde 2,1-aminomutase